MKEKYQEIELKLFHDGKFWFAKNASIKFKAVELFELEKKIEKNFSDYSQKNQIMQLKVFLRYDFDNFPKWLHQYHTHYFNRTLIFSL